MGVSAILEYTQIAKLELESQNAIHRFTDSEKDSLDAIAWQFATHFEHKKIMTADVRYAAAVVVIRR
jgi:hypothetical protein